MSKGQVTVCRRGVGRTATFGSVTNSQAQTGQSGVYTFTLTAFRITDARSLHNDTDFVSFAVAMASRHRMPLTTSP